MNFPALTVCAIFVTGVFTWPAANVLFAGPGAQGVDLIARGIAFAILVASYFAFIEALFFVVRLLPRAWAGPWRLLIVCILAILGSLAAPLAPLPPVFFFYSVCTQPSFPCANPEFLALVPHALHVASRYPSTQVLAAVPALVLLLWLGQPQSPAKAGPRNAP